MIDTEMVSWLLELLCKNLSKQTIFKISFRFGIGNLERNFQIKIKHQISIGFDSKTDTTHTAEHQNDDYWTSVWLGIDI